MTDCAKVKECGREAYARDTDTGDLLCLSHLKGWTPKRSRPAKKATASRSSTKTTKATGTTSTPDTEVTT